MRLGFLDLGTNSVRLDIYEVSADGARERIFRRREVVRVGDSLFLTNRLNAEAALRTLSLLEEYAEAVKQNACDRVVAVATSAMRDAIDGRDFLESVRGRTGFETEVVSGDDEAKLIAEAIVEFDSLPVSPFATVDIGGGSAEVSFCSGREILASRSFNLGASRLQQTFLLSNPPTPTPEDANPVARVREHIRTMFKDHWPGVGEGQAATVIGSSGTGQTLLDICSHRGASGSAIPRGVLEDLLADMSVMNLDELLAIPGMHPRRADVLFAGGLVMEEAMAFFGARELQVSEYSLRDGLLLRELRRLKSGDF